MLRHMERSENSPEKTGLRKPQLTKRATPTPASPQATGFHSGPRKVGWRLPLFDNNSSGSFTALMLTRKKQQRWPALPDENFPLKNVKEFPPKKS